MMAIEMVGGVYCPLSPRDPQHRLHALVQQTQSHVVLVHDLTADRFNNENISLNIDLTLASNHVEIDVDADRLSSVIVTSDDIAYIIFTSGSTGTPKAVCPDVSILCLTDFNPFCHRFKFDTRILLAVCNL